jgi:hypothetical protein
MKRSLLAFILVAASSLAVPAVAHAARGGALGIGLIVGDPTGITGAYRMGNHTAVDVAVGLDELDHDSVYVHAEFLFILGDLLRGGSVSLGPYVGVGGFLVDFKDDIGIGARAPFGLSLDFHAAPLQIFLEVAAFILLVPDTNSDLGVALGLRYYF